MAARSVASLSLTFGLVSIPVKVYLATESSSAIKFKLLAPGGAARLRQQYVADEPLQRETLLTENEGTDEGPMAAARASVGAFSGPFKAAATFPSLAAARDEAPLGSRTPFSTEPDTAAAPVVERSEMVKGYEFEKGKFVFFTSAELKALEAESRQTIDIVRFIPAGAIDPIYYEKAYFLAPDKRGSKPYSLLMQAMQHTGRCALAKWAWRSKEYVVQIRPTAAGLVLQQLLYADEVRAQQDLKIEFAPVGQTELQLATQIIDQISADAYDPTEFVDEEKQRILAAVERKIAGQESVAPAHEPASSGQVVDLIAALRASLCSPAVEAPKPRPTPASKPITNLAERKPLRRSTKTEPAKAAKARKA